MLPYTPDQCHHLPARVTCSGVEWSWLPGWYLSSSVVQAVLWHLCPWVLGCLREWLLCCFLTLTWYHSRNSQSEGGLRKPLKKGLVLCRNRELDLMILGGHLPTHYIL